MFLQDKEHKLEGVLSQYQKVAVAFSGGADSSLLLKKALEVLGEDNVVVLTARSCLLKQSEVTQAETWLSRHGYDGNVIHEFVELQPLSWDEFVQNPANRCYLCKLRVYGLFNEICQRHNTTHLIDGTNFDDIHTDRPGLQAIKELDIGTPLAESEFTKEEVRILSKKKGLDTWDRPSASCLATRIPDGLLITKERITFIERLELFAESMGFKGCRVRLDREKNDKVYIQVQEKDVANLAMGANRVALIHLFNDYGAKKIFLDLNGR